MDKELKKALLKEKRRQSQNIELIASENYTSKAVRGWWCKDYYYNDTKAC